MSFIDKSWKDRQVIPRWHPYSVAVWLNTTKSINIFLNNNNQDLEFLKKVAAWHNNKSLVYACDLLGSAIALKIFEDVSVKKAAKQIIRNRHKVSTIALKSAYYFLSPHKKSSNFQLIELSNNKYYEIIASIKYRVRSYPRNPILWMDLAFWYVVLGQKDQARKCVNVALSLNKKNRYLLRCASRFFLHDNDPEFALRCIRKSDITSYDPWLIAAEIAISDLMNKSSKYIKSAREFIDNDSIDRFHISEVASALGTVELKNGSIKTGRKLFRASLDVPTENSLAQAICLKKQFGNLDKIVVNTHVERDFESKARLFFEKGKYKKSILEIEEWIKYQPFSSKPSVFGSYIASVVLSDFRTAIELTQKGMRSSPNDFVLNNNYAFSLISLGNIEEAENILNKFRIESLKVGEQNVLKATRAVINFRKKNFKIARQFYSEAIRYFKKEKDYHSATIATLCWSREESLAKSEKAQELKEETMNMATKNEFNELIFAVKKIK